MSKQFIFQTKTRSWKCCEIDFYQRIPNDSKHCKSKRILIRIFSYFCNLSLLWSVFSILATYHSLLNAHVWFIEWIENISKSKMVELNSLVFNDCSLNLRYLCYRCDIILHVNECNIFRKWIDFVSVVSIIIYCFNLFSFFSSLFLSFH